MRGGISRWIVRPMPISSRRSCEGRLDGAASGSARSRPVSSRILRRRAGATPGGGRRLAARALEQPDDHPEAGGVDEVDVLEVEDDARLTADDDLDDRSRSRGAVVRSRSPDARATAQPSRSSTCTDEVHRPNLPPGRG